MGWGVREGGGWVEVGGPKRGSGWERLIRGNMTEREKDGGWSLMGLRMEVGDGAADLWVGVGGGENWVGGGRRERNREVGISDDFQVSEMEERSMGRLGERTEAKMP